MNIDGAMGASSGGAAGLGQGRAGGGGAPDRAVVSVCGLCNMRRADLKGPCGHKYHAREFGRPASLGLLIQSFWTALREKLSL